MPVYNSDHSKQLEFGYGDIEVAPGLLDTTKIIGAVCFFQCESTNSKPIGERSEITTSQLEDTAVRFLFNNVESIDIVIAALEEAKKLMLIHNERKVKGEGNYESME